MPAAPRKACSCTGCINCTGRCPNTTTGGRCTNCTAQSRKGHRANDRIYKSPRWRALRRQVLREQPWCATPGCTELTHDIDHIKTVEMHPELAYERSNLQGLCVPHHSAKTARETLHRD